VSTPHQPGSDRPIPVGSTEPKPGAPNGSGGAANGSGGAKAPEPVKGTDAAKSPEAKPVSGEQAKSTANGTEAKPASGGADAKPTTGEQAKPAANGTEAKPAPGGSATAPEGARDVKSGAPGSHSGAPGGQAGRSGAVSPGPARTGAQTPPWQRGAQSAGTPAAAQQSGAQPYPGAPRPAAAPAPQPKPATAPQPAAKQAPAAAGPKPDDAATKAVPASSAQGSAAQSARPNPAPAGPVSAEAPKTAPVRQTAPQTNVQKPVAQAGLQKPAPQTGRPAADPARKQAAQAKAAVIDGPTRHIDREDLAKDLPDLSEVRHPTPVAVPAESAATKRPAVTVAATTPVGDPLRASVQIRKVDPWSTLKVALILSVSMFFVWMFAVGFLYIVLDGMGVWDRLNNAFTDIVSESSESGLVTAGQVFGYSALIGGINIILFTALATVGAFIYNLCTDLVGGVEVTLADRD
jgi:hypothetical protein